MFEPNVAIADQNYLGRGVLLLVTPKGRRMVRHAMTDPMMRSKWYQMRTGPVMLFLQGDWDQEYDGGRTLMFIEASGETQEFFYHLLDDANHTTSELSILFSD